MKFVLILWFGLLFMTWNIPCILISLLVSLWNWNINYTSIFINSLIDVYDKLEHF